MGESKRKQTCPSLEVKAELGTGMKLLNAHRLQLTIDRLNPFAVERQVVIICPGIRQPIGTLRRDQTYPGLL